MFGALVVLLFGEAAWQLQVWLTKRDRWFSVEQMLQHHSHGLPMKWHFAIMWSDPFAITPLLAFLVWLNKKGWDWTWDGGIVIVACAASVVMHWQYLYDKIQNSHVHDGRLTWAMPVHFFYMWVAFSIIGHTYVREVHENPMPLIILSSVLFVHTVLGTHLIVKLLRPVWFTPNQPPADTATIVVWIGAAAALSLFSWLNLNFVR
jgi:hypothetical protein